MKPIVIKMSAFGPYKKTEVVDFRQLKEHQLFVVSGATGAGKTTIFDAICFALYGSSSGSDRDQTKMLRSDFADDDTHTAVELIFEMHGRIYRVLRQLSHVKEGRKTATGEKYELYEQLADGTEVAVVERQRVSDINPKLEEIIGLTYDQFSQIVMLPQGEFRKLLTSASENKEAILRKIFKTDRYGKMVKIVEEKKVKAELDARAVKAMRDSYMEQIAGALPARESSLFIHLQNRANVYQIQEALLEEKVYYEQLTDINFTKYEQSQKQYNEMNERFISAKALNERIEAFEQLQQKYACTLELKPVYEEKRLQAEAAQRATMLHYLDEQCKQMAAELTNKKVIIEQGINQVAQAEKVFLEAQAVFEQQRANESVRQQAHDQVQQLQALIPVYEQIEQSKRALEQATALREQSQMQVKNLSQQLAEGKQTQQQLLEQVIAYENEVKAIPQILEAIHQAEGIVKVFEKYHEASRIKAQQDSNLALANEQYESATAAYTAEEQKWLQSQAQVLASTLKPGCECPVCGSTEHKQVHFEDSIAVNEKLLQQLKEKALKAEQIKNALQIEVSVASSMMAELEKDLKNASITVEEAEQYKERLLKLQQHYSELKRSNEALEQLKEQQKQQFVKVANLEQQQQVAQQQLQSCEQSYFEKSSAYLQQQQLLNPEIASLQLLHVSIFSAQQHVQMLKVAWEQAQKNYYDGQVNLEKAKQAQQFNEEQCAQLTSKLNDSREQFKVKMQEAKFESYASYSAAKRTDEEIEQLKQAHLQFVNELHALQMKVQEEQLALQNTQAQDLSELQQQVLQLKEEEKNAFEQYKLAQKYEQQCEQFHEKLGAVAEEIFRLEEVTNQLIDIHNLLKGQNAKKISFERYVQIGYLEQITEAANIRLRNLSNGQYSLICSDRQEAHGRQSGLSLDVYDSYTGQTRDVKTLSGGEKFNASLSLALGMAEVIQSFQGNVRIDTMFIDEGFGSLDEESLMRAIDTLFDLQNTGRMIGVISHVAELKDAFPAILQVEKQKEGYSQTKFILK